MGWAFPDSRTDKSVRLSPPYISALTDFRDKSVRTLSVRLSACRPHKKGSVHNLSNPSPFAEAARVLDQLRRAEGNGRAACAPATGPHAGHQPPARAEAAADPPSVPHHHQATYDPVALIAGAFGDNNIML